jgi:spore germination protein GerM
MKDFYGFLKLFLKLLWLAILIVSSYFLFFYKFENYQSQIPEKYIKEKKEVKTGEYMNFEFYYTDGVKLIPEDRKVKISDNRTQFAKNLVEEYMKGSKSSDLYTPMPENTVVRNVFLKDGVLYVDFSRRIRTGYNGGIIPELLILYGFTNTVCELNFVDKVKFLINGDDTDVLISHVYTGEPLTPDENLIQKF